MNLTSILILGAVALIVGRLANQPLRVYILFVISVLAIYALQPVLPIRGMDFWLPTGTLALTACSWLLTAPSAERSWRKNWHGILLLVVLVLALGAIRYLDIDLPLTASRPPQISQIAICLASFMLLAILLSRLPAWVSLVWMAILLSLFIILKNPGLATSASVWLRRLNYQSVELASPLDLRWLGFSYVAFRILHTIRDRQAGRLPSVSLLEYVTYVIFFPSFTAGPIDRLERFIQDLRNPKMLTAGDFSRAGSRLLLGLFKKFALADSLAIIALNGTNALQVHTGGWLWVLLYAFAFQIYFDFSGYTDIAIAIGNLLGVQLPENFSAPYSKPNLTQFWNNWHMTLTQWFRAYFFNPVTRALRSARQPISVPFIIFFTQMSTMILIGLWHGITWNFILWGVWHGLGLFIHNRWNDWARSHPVGWMGLPAPKFILNVLGVLLTFHYVALGWVFFALPTPEIAWHVFLGLFGVI